MKEFYKREQYLKKIRGFYDEDEIIKVITEVRRCGKPTLLETVKEELKERGISDRNIISIHLDRRPYKSVKKVEKLEEVIDEIFEKDIRKNKRIKNRELFQTIQTA